MTIQQAERPLGYHDRDGYIGGFRQPLLRWNMVHQNEKVPHIGGTSW